MRYLLFISSKCGKVKLTCQTGLFFWMHKTYMLYQLIYAKYVKKSYISKIKFLKTGHNVINVWFYLNIFVFTLGLVLYCLLAHCILFIFN